TIETSFEGQIHTGKMMKALLKLVMANDISVLNRIEVTALREHGSHVELDLNSGIILKCRKVCLCTNAFTRQLYDLDVVPARAQVLVTAPIENLKIKGCFHFDEGFYFFRN